MSDITNNSDVCQWYLIVDHEQIPIGEATSLTVPGTLTVGGLKTRIKEKEQNDLAQVDTRTLTIFGCKDSSINLFSDDEDAGDEGTVLNKLKKVFSNHWQMVEKLDVERTVESLQLLNETLIIQVPGALYATPLFCAEFPCQMSNASVTTAIDQDTIA